MKVTLKDRELENDDFLPLKYKKIYTVACLSVDLDSNGRRFAYLYEPDHMFAHPLCYYIDNLEITDPSIPSDWITCVFTEGISTPTLVCAPPFIAGDKDFYIGLHDLNLEEEQEQQVIDYINSLEKNTQT